MTGLRFPKPSPRIMAKRAVLRERARQSRAVLAAVKKRDGGRCVVCRKPGYEHHHVLYRSLGGKDVVENLATLCTTHHQDIHAHLLRLISTPRGWRVERG